MPLRIKFNIKIDENLGMIYEYPILKVQGEFNETEVDEFIEMLSKDIREKVNKYIKDKERRKE